MKFFKSNKRKIILIILCIIIILLIIFLITRKNTLNNQVFDAAPAQLSSDNFTIENKNDDKVLIKFSRVDGIEKIEGDNIPTISPNGKTDVAVDMTVEPNKKYNFNVTTSSGATSTESFTTPAYHIELTEQSLGLQLQPIKDNLNTKFLSNHIATNFINMNLGKESYVDSEIDMSRVRTDWNSFGATTGEKNWRDTSIYPLSYYSGPSAVYNTNNSTNFTGYYYPETGFKDIDLYFEATVIPIPGKTTGADYGVDDDGFGALARFNVDSTGKVFNTYMFFIDGHTNNNNRNKGWCI